MSRIVGHYAPWLLAAVVVVLIAATLLPGAADYVPWEARMVLFAGVLGLALTSFAHSRRLCERCIASLPLDASTVAERYALRFRVAHLFERKLFAVGYVALVVVCSFLYSDPVGRYGWAATQASLVYLLFVYVTHQ